MVGFYENETSQSDLHFANLSVPFSLCDVFEASYCVRAVAGAKLPGLSTLQVR